MYGIPQCLRNSRLIIKLLTKKTTSEGGFFIMQISLRLYFLSNDSFYSPCDFSNKIKNLLPENIKLHSLRLQETETSFAEWYAIDNE